MVEELQYTVPGALYGMPHVKDGCGIFGMLSRRADVEIPSGKAVTGINTVRHRGSSLGAGFSSMRLGNSGISPFRLKAFVSDGDVAEELSRHVASSLGEVLSSAIVDFGGSRIAGMPVIEMTVALRDGCDVSRSVDGINGMMLSPQQVRGRIFSYGRYVDVFKGVGYPDEVASLYRLEDDSRSAQVWIAHARQPTNSPGALPIWSHPFSSYECAIVHNGDISSFGANMAYLESRGYRSHVGTDSEIIAKLMEILVREEGLAIEDALTILANPRSRKLSAKAREMLTCYRNARLDGPFSVVGSYGTGSDCYLFAVADRSKFRPLIIGEDEDFFYAASEESQIRALSPDAEVWQADTASFLLCSVRHGMMAAGTVRGRSRSPPISTVGKQAQSSSSVNDAIREELQGREEIVIGGVDGTRFIGMGVSFSEFGGERKVFVDGYPGNCLGNLNDGGVFEVRGNAADDIGDTMSAGKIIIHGSAGDVAGQALQGGRIYIRGNVGNRAAIQMREYEGRRPYLVACETAGDYLGEYMAGGAAVVLNLSGSPAPVGDYVGTGMVGGRIYIRGKVSPSQVGLLPREEDVMEYLSSLAEEGLLEGRTLSQADPSDPAGLSRLLPPEVFERLTRLFYTSRHSKLQTIERRYLAEDEVMELHPVLSECFSSFGLESGLLEEVLGSEYTVISVR